MLNKVRLWVRKEVRVLVAGFISFVIALIQGVYSALALDPKLMQYPPFRWLPFCRFYNNALDAIAKLEIMEPAQSDYYAGLYGSEEQFSIVDSTSKGFKELVISMRKAQMVNQPINNIKMEKVAYEIWDPDANKTSERIWLTLKLFRDDEIIKELPLTSLWVLEDAVESIIRRRFAIFTIILSSALFVIGITLMLIAIRMGDA